MKNKRLRQRKRVLPKRMITLITETFKPILAQPALKNMILTIIAITLCGKFRINELSRHLPIDVKREKTKQKRLLRFIDTEFPLKKVMERWAIFVLETIYQTGRKVVPILIDETDLIGPLKAIVAAVPFRQRAIVIYFQVYTNADIQSMKIKSHNVLVQKFCLRVNKIATQCLPKKSQPIVTPIFKTKMR